jgi:hypothetical protein
MKKGNIYQILLFLIFFLVCSMLAPRLLNGIDCKNYQYPFYPALLKASGEGALSVTDFKAPRSCRACHILNNKNWDDSSHSHAFSDPIFLAMWKMAQEETQGKTDGFCISCHAPIGLLTQDLKTPDDEASAQEISKQGVSCDVCHTVNQTTYECAGIKTPHNASLLLQPGNIKWGPIDNCDSTFHESAFLEIYTKSEFCGNCHNLFHHESGYKIVKTYEEWKGSVYAQKGIECQDCHMMPVNLAMETADTLEKPKNPGKASTIGPMRESIHEHKFIGGSPIIKKGPPSMKHTREVEKRLKGAARLEAEAITSGAKGTLKITVHNQRAGHNLPTGMPGLRQVWLEALVTDKNGSEIFHTGALDNQGRLPGEAVRFSVNATDKNGKSTFKPWAIEAFESDTSIPPKAERAEELEFSIPADTVWPLTAKVVLYYRGFPLSLLEEILPDLKTTIPVFEMADKTIEITR